MRRSCENGRTSRCWESSGEGGPLALFERKKWRPLRGKRDGFDGQMLKCKIDSMSVTLPGTWLLSSLEELFESHGFVMDVKLIEGDEAELRRGFAFVTMA